MSELSLDNRIEPNTPMQAAPIQANFDKIVTHVNGSIGRGNITPGSVGDTELATNAVTEAKVKDGSIPLNKLKKGLIFAKRSNFDGSQANYREVTYTTAMADAGTFVCLDKLDIVAPNAVLVDCIAMLTGQVGMMQEDLSATTRAYWTFEIRHGTTVLATFGFQAEGPALQYVTWSTYYELLATKNLEPKLWVKSNHGSNIKYANQGYRSVNMMLLLPKS